MVMSAEAKERLRAKSQPVRERLSQSGPRKFVDRSHYISLTGDRAVAAPGGYVIVRLLPRWDIKLSMMFDKKKNLWVPNPDYQVDSEEIALAAKEHWYEDPQRRLWRDWCLKVLGDDVPCPVCELTEALFATGNEADATHAKRIRAHEVYLYNVIVRRQLNSEINPPKWEDRQYAELDGTTRPWVRILPAPPTMYLKFNNLMTGGSSGDVEGEASMAYGEIFDITGEEGRDASLVRPSAQGQQWDVRLAPKTSRLYEKGDTRWKNWMDLLYNLPDEITEDKLRSYDSLYKTLNGRPPISKTTTSVPSTGRPAFRTPPIGEPPDPEFGDGEADGMDDGGVAGDESGFEPDSTVEGSDSQESMFDPPSQEELPPSPRPTPAKKSFSAGTMRRGR